MPYPQQIEMVRISFETEQNWQVNLVSFEKISFEDENEETFSFSPLEFEQWNDSE
jgi:hypothetical protein